MLWTPSRAAGIAIVAILFCGLSPRTSGIFPHSSGQTLAGQSWRDPPGRRDLHLRVRHRVENGRFSRGSSGGNDVTGPLPFSRGEGFAALGMGFLALSAGADPAKVAGSPSAFLELFFFMAFSPVLGLNGGVPRARHYANVVYRVRPYRCPDRRITRSASHLAIRFGDDAISMKDSVSRNTVAIKNFAIGFTSLGLRLAIDLVASHRSVAAVEPDTRVRVSGHPRLVRALLIATQIVLGTDAVRRNSCGADASVAPVGRGVERVHGRPDYRR